MKFFKRLLTDKRGQGITEYALILGLVVLGVWAAVVLTGLGPAISGIFADVTAAVGGCCTPPVAPPG